MIFGIRLLFNILQRQCLPVVTSKYFKGVLHYNPFMTSNTYDDFSQDYDRFVNWDARLQAEIPFIEARLSELDLPLDQKAAVLDAACGTGMHAIELARRGYRAAGADLSPRMVEKAQKNAVEAGVEACVQARRVYAAGGSIFR